MALHGLLLRRQRSRRRYSGPKAHVRPRVIESAIQVLSIALR
jgi:hypothetical protein